MQNIRKDNSVRLAVRLPVRLTVRFTVRLTVKFTVRHRETHHQTHLTQSARMARCWNVCRFVTRNTAQLPLSY
jgi:hypothetical protein